VCQEQPAAARDCQRHLTGRAQLMLITVVGLVFDAMVALLAMA
jgi:hypothetical protein